MGTVSVGESRRRAFSIAEDTESPFGVSSSAACGQQRSHEVPCQVARILHVLSPKSMPHQKRACMCVRAVGAENSQCDASAEPRIGDAVVHVGKEGEFSVSTLTSSSDFVLLAVGARRNGSRAAANYG